MKKISYKKLAEDWIDRQTHGDYLNRSFEKTVRSLVRLLKKVGKK